MTVVCCLQGCGAEYEERALELLHNCGYDLGRARLLLTSQLGSGKGPTPKRRHGFATHHYLFSFTMPRLARAVVWKGELLPPECVNVVAEGDILRVAQNIRKARPARVGSGAAAAPTDLETIRDFQ